MSWVKGASLFVVLKKIPIFISPGITHYQASASMHKITALLALWWVSVSLPAQKDANIDSLRLALDSSRNPAEEVLIRVGMANYFIYYNLDSADHYVSSVLGDPELLEALPEGFSRHLLIKAWVHQGRMELERARDRMLQVDSILSEYGDREGQLELQLNLASVLIDLKDTLALGHLNRWQQQTDTASGNSRERRMWLMFQYLKGRALGDREQYRQALQQLAEAAGSPLLIEFEDLRGGIYNSISIYLKKIGDYALAEAYMRRALANPRLYPFERKMMLLNLAEQFFTRGMLDSCQKNLNQVFGLTPLSPDECRRAHFTQAKVGYQERDYQTALDHITSARECAGNMQNPEVAFDNRLVEARIRLRLGEWNKAVVLLAEAEALVAANPGLNTLGTRTALADIQLATGLMRTNPALMEVYDSLLQFKEREARQRADRELKEVIAAYETLEKEKAIELLQRDNALHRQKNRQQRQGLAALALLAIALGVIGMFWRRNLLLTRENNALLEEEKAELIFEKAELEVLNRKLAERVKRAEQPDQTERTYEIKGRDKTYRIPESTIMYVEAYKDGVRFHTEARKPIWADCRLKTVEEDLSENPRFVRIYRSVLVNTDFVDWVNQQSLRMQDGTEHKIGRSYKKDLRDRLGLA